MSRKDDKDRAYAEGVKEGLEGNFVDDFAEDLSRGWPTADREFTEIKEKGYDWGREHRHDPEHSKSDDDGPCFISTACVVARGLPDDCRELAVLRRFRDELSRSEPGRTAVQEYYRDAPEIVASIDASPDPGSVYRDLYEGLVRRCVGLIERGRPRAAFDTYRRIVHELKQTYVRPHGNA